MLVTGKGNGGSWQIRGEQLGSALGATVIGNATPADIENADSIFLVKRTTGFIEQRKTAAPLVWDVVDAWPQPAGNLWKREDCIKHIIEKRDAIRADYVVAATKQMAADIGADLTLRHHGRNYYRQNVIREKVSAVAYEGSARYLGRWVEKITEQCIKRGWVFVVNPNCLTEVDIILALRDYPHKGYATDNWKSNVKLQNAQNSGTPVICAREAGYTETASGGEEWADTPDELFAAFDKLSGQAERLVAASQLRRQAYHAIDAARDFEKWRAGKF